MAFDTRFANRFVYVVDTDNHRIQQFTTGGTFVREWGELGDGEGQFSSPRGIAFDSSRGDLYVADTGNHRIQKFSTRGTFILQWGTEGSGEGQFSSPKMS